MEKDAVGKKTGKNDIVAYTSVCIIAGNRTRYILGKRMYFLSITVDIVTVIVHDVT